MAFSVVAATNGGAETANTTSHTINLPASISSGDLLIAIFSVDQNPDVTWPVGWTELYAVADGSVNRCEVRYRVADGGEGSTISLTTSTSQGSAHNTYRITGQHGSSAPEAGTAVTGATNAPNPPSLSPSWGAEDTLWLEILGHNAGITSITYSTNYANGFRNQWNNFADGAGVASAERELNASSNDPDAMSINTTRNTVTNTIAIRPAAGGGALLDAAVSCAGTIGSALTTTITAAASVSASAVVTAALTTSIILGASVNASASAAASLTTSITMDASANAAAAQSSELTVLDIDLFDAAVSASASATGELATQIPFSAAAAGSVTTTAALTTQIQFSGALTAASSQASDLTTSITVDSAVSASCTVASELTAPQQALLAASPAGTAAASAALTTGAPIENVVSYTPYFAKIGAADALFTKSFIKASHFTPKRKKEVWF